MNRNKTILQRIWLGIKLGWKLPSLPASVEKYHNYPLTRIFRVIGGISIILFLSSPSWVGNSYFYWIVFILAMLQFLYIIVISLIKIGYIVYLWKNKNLEVRNSPLDYIASSTVKLATWIEDAGSDMAKQENLSVKKYTHNSKVKFTEKRYYSTNHEENKENKKKWRE